MHILHGREKFGRKIEFPIIDDLSMKVANAYGMVHPGEAVTAASRCVFVIDDKQIVRAMIYYPLSAGRNMDEILRLIDSLQTTDKHSVATPANWRPGEKVIVPPAGTTKLAEERMNDKSLECTDWFFCKKNI
jgi:peroxiredoxin (alkyl hydroperoxide reductase subunit C)